MSVFMTGHILSYIGQFIRSKTALYILLTLGLCGWIWLQSQKIGSLTAKNQAQAQTILTQSATINQLQQDAARNQQLTLEITKAESEARSKSNDVINAIPEQTKQTEAYRATAPRSIIEFLRQP